MDLFKEIIEYIGSYVWWARILMAVALAGSVGTLVLAHKTTTPEKSPDGASPIIKLLNELRVLVSAYTLPAKILIVGGILVSAIVAVSFRDITFLQIHTTKTYIRIYDIEILSKDLGSDIRLDAKITLDSGSAKTFSYPGSDTVQWQRVDKGMPDKTVALPNSAHYEVDFVMKIKDSSHHAADISDLESQEIIVQTQETQVYKLPFKGKYEFYETHDNVRSATPSARLRYKIFQVK